MCVLKGAALGAMIGQMTYGKRQFENLDTVMRRLIPPFHQAMNELLQMVDADSSAFNSYMVSLCFSIDTSTSQYLNSICCVLIILVFVFVAFTR